MSNSPSLAKLSLQPFVEEYISDYGSNYTVFVVMRFAKVHLLTEVYRMIKEQLNEFSILAVRADEKRYADSLWQNVQTYLLGANAGIVIFDNVAVGDKFQYGFNPNVSIEAGYLLGLNKPLMLVKDKNLKKLPTDFSGLLYYEYDGNNPDTIKNEINIWAESLVKHEQFFRRNS